METIKVLEEYLIDYDTSVQLIDAEHSKINTKMREISSILTSDNWKGDAHDKCLEAYQKISQYQTDTMTCYAELKSAIQQLIDNTDGFVTNSPAVAKLV